MRSSVIVAIFVAALGVASVAVADGRFGSSVAGHRDTLSANAIGEPGPRRLPPPTTAGAEPTLAVVGASIAAGTGAPGPEQAWPALLAKAIGWKVAVSADPGAGYLALGQHRRGPIRRLMDGLDLKRLHPAMVLVEAGYNDIAWPTSVVNAAVQDSIREIRTESPTSSIGLITVFPHGDRPTPEMSDTDTTIVAAARSIDPGVYVFDPLAMHWDFPRLPDRLHPDQLGHQWIADRLTTEFRTMGIARQGRPGP
ncbi:MAG: SGNH/GDSL hydrolase family protein [Nocardia sp.]|nr:SGNH/GDSL hydrolase family protein [Nocardia sp.]